MLDISKLVVAVFVGVLLGACGGPNAGKAPDSNQVVDMDSYTVGTLQAMVNGKLHIWKTSKPMSEWYGGLDTPRSEATVYSLATPNNHYPGNLTFSIARSNNKWRTMSIEIFHGKPDIYNFSSANDGAGEIKIADFNMSGDSMKITGTFSADMPAVYQAGGEPDMSNILALKDGTFEIDIPPRGK